MIHRGEGGGGARKQLEHWISMINIRRSASFLNRKMFLTKAKNAILMNLRAEKSLFLSLFRLVLVFWVILRLRRGNFTFVRCSLDESNFFLIISHSWKFPFWHMKHKIYFYTNNFDVLEYNNKTICACFWLQNANQPSFHSLQDNNNMMNNKTTTAKRMKIKTCITFVIKTIRVSKDYN